uniref:Uncharacterized protein n=1 Tax=Eutreptiella gymnastica TaxID=73025 RepID=A0A7S4FV22_9EUGL
MRHKLPNSSTTNIRTGGDFLEASGRLRVFPLSTPPPDVSWSPEYRRFPANPVCRSGVRRPKPPSPFAWPKQCLTGHQSAAFPLLHLKTTAPALAPHPWVRALHKGMVLGDANSNGTQGSKTDAHESKLQTDMPCSPTIPCEEWKGAGQSAISRVRISCSLTKTLSTPRALGAWLRCSLQ